MAIVQYFNILILLVVVSRICFLKLRDCSSIAGYSITCQKNEHQVPLTLYALSDTPIHSTSFSIVDMYSASDISYYKSEGDLDDKTEFSKTICILENDQMAYRLIVNVYIFQLFHLIN